MEVTLLIDGREVHYSRTEHADGTFTESGLPEGMHPRPSLSELLAFAMAPRVKRVTSKVKK